ncbi:hypothetical protein EAG_03977 [Camponotus floridanus]|uniref:MADF domain-containing protein n=1 Tax=Camponotus floridanus TaxID=104421 RepID=E2AT69_CAMFO|nr:hypothetical protein EAG_03977 [Camponotus floridanus]
MSAEEVEKRWSSLRDMFGREKRRQALPPSGSGYEPVKEWELYKNMSFLTPHVAHRKTKTSFVQQNQLQTSLLETSTRNTFLPLKKFKQSSNISLYDHSYSGSVQSIEENKPSLNIENEEITMTDDNEILNRPASTLSNSSSASILFSETSTSSNSVNLKTPLILKPLKKIMPEMDEFARHRRSKDDKIDRDLAETSREISAAIKEVSSQMHYDKHFKDGYHRCLP